MIFLFRFSFRCWGDIWGIWGDMGGYGGIWGWMGQYGAGEGGLGMARAVGGV